MGFFFEWDNANKVKIPRFVCHCEGVKALRVSVPREGKEPYATSFASCYDCNAMFLWDRDIPASPGTPNLQSHRSTALVAFRDPIERTI